LFSLISGLLFRPGRTMAQAVQTEDREGASKLRFALIVLYMINTVFLVIGTPVFAEWFGEYGRWGVALLFPLIQYALQLIVYVFCIWLGLLLFARGKMPQDREGRRHKMQLVRMTYPYTAIPALILSVLVSITGSVVLFDITYMIGLVYTFLLTMHALTNIYGVTPRVALWAPIFIQLLLGILLYLVTYWLNAEYLLRFL